MVVELLDTIISTSVLAAILVGSIMKLNSRFTTLENITNFLVKDVSKLSEDFKDRNREVDRKFDKIDDRFNELSAETRDRNRDVDRRFEKITSDMQAGFKSVDNDIKQLIKDFSYSRPSFRVDDREIVLKLDDLKERNNVQKRKRNIDAGKKEVSGGYTEDNYKNSNIFSFLEMTSGRHLRKGIVEIPSVFEKLAKSPFNYTENEMAEIPNGVAL